MQLIDLHCDTIYELKRRDDGSSLRKIRFLLIWTACAGRGRSCRYLPVLFTGKNGKHGKTGMRKFSVSRPDGAGS